MRQIAIELGIDALLEVHGVNHPFDRTRIGRIKVGSFSASVLFSRMEVVEPVKTWLKRRLRPAYRLKCRTQSTPAVISERALRKVSIFLAS